MTKIALYQPDIALNVGNIIRSCVCFDKELIIIEPCGFPFDLNRIKKSALDYIHHAKITRYISFEEFYEAEVVKNNHQLVLASTKASTNYCDFQFNHNQIIMFGRESCGVPQEVFDKCHHRIFIPMKNNMRSLNVAISCGIIMAKLVCQNC